MHALRRIPSPLLRFVVRLALLLLAAPLAAA